jgi:hypothetical protein
MKSGSESEERSFSTECVPRGTEEIGGLESVVTLTEMEVGPPKPPCRGRL